MAEGSVQAVLEIPRTKLIDRLKEVRQEHRTKREEAEQKARDARQSYLDLIDQLDADQVANIFDHWGIGGGKDWLEEVIEAGKFKTIPAEPTGIETSLDRLIRVFELASNDKIEVTPSDPVYSYL